MENRPSLSVNICGIEFSNPCIAASGTFGFGDEYSEFYSLSDIGGISVKGLTVLPRQGNPPSRIAETAGGMLNSVGLQNPGVDAFIKDYLPRLNKQDVVVIANIAGNTTEDYCAITQKLADSQVDMMELNISCPNVKEGGIAFGTHPQSVCEITKAVKSLCKDKPLMVKLSPNVTDIKEMAMAAQQGGADAISLINTLTGMVVDVNTRKPVLANVTGGLSGPAVMPVALRMVHEVCKVVDVPVVGMGGIMSGEDAAAFMLCGASAFMVGTANLISPTACVDIVSQLEAYLVKQGVFDVNEIVGALKI